MQIAGRGDHGALKKTSTFCHKLLAMLFTKIGRGSPSVPSLFFFLTAASPDDFLINNNSILSKMLFRSATVPHTPTLGHQSLLAGKFVRRKRGQNQPNLDLYQRGPTLSWLLKLGDRHR